MAAPKGGRRALLPMRQRAASQPHPRRTLPREKPRQRPGILGPLQGQEAQEWPVKTAPTRPITSAPCARCGAMTAFSRTENTSAVTASARRNGKGERGGDGEWFDLGRAAHGSRELLPLRQVPRRQAQAILPVLQGKNRGALQGTIPGKPCGGARACGGRTPRLYSRRTLLDVRWRARRRQEKNLSRLSP